MHRTYCGEIETARWNPSFKNRFRLARALGVSLCQVSASGPVYEKTVSRPLSCWRPNLAGVGGLLATRGSYLRTLPETPTIRGEAPATAHLRLL